MKLKRFMAFLMVMVMVLSLAACGDKGDGTNGDLTNDETTDQGSSDQETGETNESANNSGDGLVVAIWDTYQEPGISEIMKDFTEETGIEVNVQVTPWDQYWTMLEAGATGGSLPDVFWMHSNEFARYAEYEMLMDLTERINNSDKVDLTKFPEDIVNLYNWQDEKQYAVPKDLDTIALWYNKTMFDEAGLSYPDENWTWDDFADACEALTKDDGSQHGFALRPSNGQAGWYNIVYDMGGTIISDDKKSSGFDQKETIEAIKFVTDIVKNGYTPSYEVVAENEEHALFEAGKVAMITQGSWMLAELCNNDYVKEHGDIAVLPKDAATGRRASIYNGLGWVADAQTDKPEEAWALIEYLGSEKAQQKQSDLGVVISAYEGTVDNWVEAYPDFNLQAYLTMMDDLVFRPYSKLTVTWENMIYDKLIDAWTGERSAEDVCAEIHEEMNTILAEE
jgi:multiple sugar transport system substrate-binding protein